MPFISKAVMYFWDWCFFFLQTYIFETLYKCLPWYNHYGWAGSKNRLCWRLYLTWLSGHVLMIVFVMVKWALKKQLCWWLYLSMTSYMAAGEHTVILVTCIWQSALLNGIWCSLHCIYWFLFLIFFFGGGRGGFTMCSMQSQKNLRLHEEKLSLLKIKRASYLQYIQCSKQPVSSLWKLKLFILWYIRSGQPQMHGYTQGSRLTVNYLSSFSQSECCK